ncbi:MAG: AMP-binding protein [Candidatus Lokiarchaeota archaeon]|nr:AMP-binding protein [Candidatus Lokiarchaeota archaeon]
MSIQLTPKEAELLEILGKMAEDSVNPSTFTSLGMRIEYWANKIPNKKGLFFKDKSWTWKSINEKANNIANYFLSLGLKPSESVAVMMENSPEFLFVTGGISKIKGISSLINVNLRKRPLIHVMKISEPRYVIVDDDCLPAIQEVISDLNLQNNQILVISKIPNKNHKFVDLSNELTSISSNNPKTIVDFKYGDVCSYIFTSGTTGFPKAVMIKHVNIGGFYAMGLQLKQDDILYNPLPLYHSHSNQSWRAVLFAGAAMALARRFSASEYWKDIKKFNANATVYIGEIPRYLLNRPESEYIPGSLKKMFGLGLRKDIWEAFQSRFNIEHIWEFYGGTDFGVPLFNIDEKPGMVGRHILPTVEIIKIDQDTGEFYKDENGFYIKCKPGEVGMLIVKIVNYSIFTLYKNHEKTIKKVLRNVFEKDDAYLKTGDLLQVHDNNWVSFADRFGDTFRWKGENVSTLEVESILNLFPAVQICNVYGVSIPNTDGKAGMATFQLDKNLDFELDQFSRFVSENLPPYAIPVFLRIIDELEFTGTHKLRKVNLRKEGYNIEEINDPVFFWNNSAKKYKDFNKIDYQNLLKNALF